MAKDKDNKSSERADKVRRDVKAKRLERARAQIADLDKAIAAAKSDDPHTKQFRESLERRKARNNRMVERLSSES